MFRAAVPDELNAVCNFYWDLADVMREATYGPAWTREIYPSRDDLRDRLAAGELFLAETPEHEWAGALVVNNLFNPEYAEVDWPSGVPTHKAVVLHLLCLTPAYQRQGLGKQLVAFAVERARSLGMRALRLDVLEGNLPAGKLYESCGFVPVTEMELYYEDTGRVMFTLYELAL